VGDRETRVKDTPPFLPDTSFKNDQIAWTQEIRQKLGKGVMLRFQLYLFRNGWVGDYTKLIRNRPEVKVKDGRKVELSLGDKGYPYSVDVGWVLLHEESD